MAALPFHHVFDENIIFEQKIARKLSSYQRLASKESAAENHRFRATSSLLAHLSSGCSIHAKSKRHEL
jgi:hypothetical protein